VTDEDRLARVRRWLLERGFSEAETERATEEGQLHLLVLDQALLPATEHLTVQEVSARTGVDPDIILRLRRALGFADVPPDELAFTEFDVEALEGTRTLMELSLTQFDGAIQLARVIGSSMARIAEAEVESSPVFRGEATSVEMAELYILTADHLLPGIARLLEYTWRRHMQEALRRVTLLPRSSSIEPVTLAIGFADLVGFTALSQQLSDAELTEMVGRFEELAYDTVARRGGRVIKMIGDEVMYTAVEPDVAALIALDLAEAYADDEMLSDVRVGLAYGPVLLREGDLYGPVVNLANRLVKIAAEGTVLTSDEDNDALADDPRLEWRSLRSRYLKGLGKVPLWVLRRAGSPEAAPRSRRHDRRGRWMVKDQVREAVERSLPRRARDDGVIGEPAAPDAVSDGPAVEQSGNADAR
jgi:adenylate cyclase